MRMRFWRRHRPDRPPRDVQIRHADGSVSHCSLVRDPCDKRGGIASWLAVPPAGTTFDPDGDVLHIGCLPPRTHLEVLVACREGWQP